MTKTPEEDPIQQWKELQDNRYNPGHWTGGRIHPIYRIRGKRVGWLLIVVGVISSTSVIATIYEYNHKFSFLWILGLTLAALPIVVGIAMIIQKAKRSSQDEKE